MKFPHPKNPSSNILFLKMENFENVFNKNEKTKILVYSQNIEGWNKELTNMKEAISNKKHPIDIASFDVMSIYT